MLASTIILSACTKVEQTAPASTNTNKNASSAAPASAITALDKATLLGVDGNANGVRDSIEALIKTFEATDNQKEAALFSAKVLQNTVLIDVKNKEALKTSGENLMSSIGCLSLRFPNYEDTDTLLNLLTEKTFDTPERMQAYDRYNLAQLGSTTTLPVGNPCDRI